MTKDDVMEHWDEIVTDDRLRLDDAEAHLDGPRRRLPPRPLPRRGAPVGRPAGGGCSSTTGTAGRPAGRSVMRFEAQPAGSSGAGGAPRVGRRRDLAVGPHISSSIFQTFSNRRERIWHRFPVTLPSRDRGRPQRCQPTVLFGYPSALHPLVHEAEAGRLRISPRRDPDARGEPPVPRSGRPWSDMGVAVGQHLRAARRWLMHAGLR